MSPNNHPIFFFRGLNTEGDDRIRLGMYRGPYMHQALVEAFKKRDSELIPVLGMSKGSLESHVERAFKYIAKVSPSHPIHLLGHSTGGLVARAVASHLGPEKVLSVTTMATPHTGSMLADFAQNFKERRPKAAHVLKLLGYDLTRKLPFISQLQCSRVREFLKNRELDPRIATQSLTFSLTREEMSLPIALVNSTFDPENQMLESDGFVQLSSQKWGKVLGQFKLDHLDQIGYPVRMYGKKRSSALSEFNAMVDLLVKFIPSSGA